MKLEIISSPRDRSLKLLQDAAKQRGLDVSTKYYVQLCHKDLAARAKPANTVAILRDPYLSKNFAGYQLALAKTLKPRQLLDATTFSQHPLYEDKLYQHVVLQSVGLSLPYSHCNAHKYIGKLKFPLIAKKRISSRSRHVFVLRSQKAFDYFFRRHHISEYLLEPMLTLKRDYRVLILGRRVLGVVERTPRLRKKGPQERLGLKVSGAVTVNQQVTKAALKASTLLGTDFCGVDVLITKSGKLYVGECNVGPQFVAAGRELEMDIAGQVVDFLIKKSKTS